MQKTVSSEQYFADTYAQARQKFLAAVGKAKGSIDTHKHPHCLTPDKQILTIDAAIFGPADAEKGCLIVSGTHGPEGFTGSAAQIALIESGLLSEHLNPMRVVLVHALNPYGFAHISRTTENNVDLNRNFVDFSEELPENSRYHELHDYLCPTKWEADSGEKIVEQSNAWIAENSFTEWFDALNAGQYQFEKGLYYGGQQREWSNITLEKIIASHLNSVTKLGLIDWHTGLGEAGQPFFLCFNQPHGDLWHRCCQWWGNERIEEAAKKFQDGKRPAYTGLVFQGINKFIAPAEMAGAVIEFGTVPIMDMFTQHCVDRWIRFGEPDPDTGLREQLKRHYKDASCPADPLWRTGVIRHALEIQSQLLMGIQSW